MASKSAWLSAVEQSGNVGDGKEDEESGEANRDGTEDEEGEAGSEDEESADGTEDGESEEDEADTEDGESEDGTENGESEEDEAGTEDEESANAESEEGAECEESEEGESGNEDEESPDGVEIGESADGEENGDGEEIQEENRDAPDLNRGKWSSARKEDEEYEVEEENAESEEAQQLPQTANRIRYSHAKKIAQLQAMYHQKTVSLRRLHEEQEEIHRTLFREARKMQRRARNQLKGVLEKGEILNCDYENKRQRLNSWSKELGKREASLNEHKTKMNDLLLEKADLELLNQQLLAKERLSTDQLQGARTELLMA